MKRALQPSRLLLVHSTQRPVVAFSAAQATLLREATTGRAIVPRLYAVGDVGAPQVVSPEQVKQEQATRPKEAPKPELAFYRKYTEAMLRRYLRLSMATGRVPSLLGRELFRGHVSSYRAESFEDTVIFCFDIERAVARLEREAQHLLKRIALQQYTHDETALMMGLSLRDVTRKYPAALDALTALLLESGMLRPVKQKA